MSIPLWQPMPTKCKACSFEFICEFDHKPDTCNSFVECEPEMCDNVKTYSEIEKELADARNLLGDFCKSPFDGTLSTAIQAVCLRATSAEQELKNIRQAPYFMGDVESKMIPAEIQDAVKDFEARFGVQFVPYAAYCNAFFKARQYKAALDDIQARLALIPAQGQAEAQQAPQSTNSNHH